MRPPAVPVFFTSVSLHSPTTPLELVGPCRPFSFFPAVCHLFLMLWMHGMHKFVTWPLLSCINSRIQSVNSTKCCCWLLFLPLSCCCSCCCSSCSCSPVGHCVDDKLYALVLHCCISVSVCLCLFHCVCACVCVCVWKKDGRVDPCWFQRPHHHCSIAKGGK